MCWSLPSGSMYSNFFSLGFPVCKYQIQINDTIDNTMSYYQFNQINVLSMACYPNIYSLRIRKQVIGNQQFCMMINLALVLLTIKAQCPFSGLVTSSLCEIFRFSPEITICRAPIIKSASLNLGWNVSDNLFSSCYYAYYLFCLLYFDMLHVGLVQFVIINRKFF